MIALLLPLAAQALPATPPAPASGVAAVLAAAPRGARVALYAVDDAGNEIVAVRADERMMPASNTKIFTTALAADTLAGTAAATAIRMEGEDVILTGAGDGRLSSAPGCVEACLATLAAAIAARTRTVRDVIGDATAFADDRWPAGMSWNNMASRYGTAISALTLDENVASVTVTPGRNGAPATVADDGYYRLVNRTVTIARGEGRVTAERLPGEAALTVAGTVVTGRPVTLTVGIDDPAHRAAWRLAGLLRAAGVTVTGRVLSRQRAPGPPPATLAPPPATIPLAALADDLRVTNKVSHNLRAELLLRRAGGGSVDGGIAALRGMLTRAGVAADAVDLSDGSGMSTYNRVTARGVVGLLRWTGTRPWGTMWRATLPVGGIDGTLARRFVGTPLAGRVFAKTGSLNATAALSGFLIAASGRTVTFSAIANDLPPGASGPATIDAALLALAAAN